MTQARSRIGWGLMGTIYWVVPDLGKQTRKSSHTFQDSKSLVINFGQQQEDAWRIMLPKGLRL